MQFQTISNSKIPIIIQNQHEILYNITPWESNQTFKVTAVLSSVPPCFGQTQSFPEWAIFLILFFGLLFVVICCMTVSLCCFALFDKDFYKLILSCLNDCQDYRKRRRDIEQDRLEEKKYQFEQEIKEILEKRKKEYPNHFITCLQKGDLVDVCIVSQTE